MSDPAQLERIREDEGAVTELLVDPANTVGAYANAAVHNIIHHDHHEQHSPSVTHSPPVTRHARPRAGSNSSHVSHVSLDYFDPVGVNELRRTLSQQQDELRRTMSQRATDNAKKSTSSQNSPESGSKRGAGRSFDLDSEETLAVGDGPFDFERTLRLAMRK